MVSLCFGVFSVYVFFMAYLQFYSFHSCLADTIAAFGNVLVHSLKTLLRAAQRCGEQVQGQNGWRQEETHPHPVLCTWFPLTARPGVGFQSSRFPRPWSCQQPFVISAAGEGGFHKWHGETGKCLGKGGGSRQWLGVGARRVYSGLLLRKSSA